MRCAYCAVASCLHTSWTWTATTSWTIHIEQHAPFGFDDIKGGLIWHLSQSSIRPSIYFRLWYHARIRSWNQPVLSNKGNVSCSRKQGPLMGLEPTTSTLLKTISTTLLYILSTTFKHQTYWLTAISRWWYVYMYIFSVCTWSTFSPFKNL